MKVHIHGHVTGTGVATYQANLGNELEAMGHDVVRTHPVKREWVVAGRRVGGFVSQQASTALLKPDQDADVLHAVSNWVFPRSATSIMVHDVNPLCLKGWESSRAMFERQKRRLRRCCLLTPTEGVRQSLAFWLRVDPDTITVAPNGVDGDRFGRRSSREDYVLYVGDYRDYKRVEDGVDIAKLNGWRFIRVGPPAKDRYGHYVKALASRVLGDGFIDLDYVDSRWLAGLYGKAQALVFTSRHEGFGIPPLEAAASGTPSILADTPVNREIHGDRAVYLNGSMVVREAVHDLQGQAAELRHNALRFTWRKSALRHLQAWGDNEV